MSIVTLFGVDPGLVHSGVVMIKIDTIKCTHRIEYEIVESDDAHRVAAWIRKRNTSEMGHVFIEQYIDRGTVFTQHGRMRQMESDLKRLIPKAKLVNNTGVKKVITDALMKLLGVWDFPTTNHRDLQAAARIALYGAVKDDTLNTAVYRLTMKELGRDVEDLPLPH